MKTKILFLISIFFILSCEMNQVEDEQQNLTQNQVEFEKPKAENDESKKGIYTGVIVSLDNDVNGEFYLNLGNNDDYYAKVNIKRLGYFDVYPDSVNPDINDYICFSNDYLSFEVKVTNESYRDASEKGDKVTICHIPPGNPDNAHTIEVSENALDAHLAHGDYIGECNENDDDDEYKVKFRNVEYKFKESKMFAIKDLSDCRSSVGLGYYTNASGEEVGVWDFLIRGGEVKATVVNSNNYVFFDNSFEEKTTYDDYRISVLNQTSFINDQKVDWSLQYDFSTKKYVVNSWSTEQTRGNIFGYKL